MLKRIIRSITPGVVLRWYHLLLASIAPLWYGNPSRHLVVIGVTGTKGKSTTSYLIAQLLERLGHRVGLTSTAIFKIAEHEWLNDKKMTMLGRFATQQMLARMRVARCTYAVIETSSEGIAQWRHRGIAYDVAVFTNLTPEHLEAHGSFEAYRNAKEAFFQHLTAFPPKVIAGKTIPKIMVINSDDPESKRLKNIAADKIISYAIQQPADCQALTVTIAAHGSQFTVNDIPCSIPLLGRFNVYNALAATAAVSVLGFPLTEIARVIKQVQPVPGRQELINEGQAFTVMVDYAHEPESQNQLFELVALMPKRRTIHVTGSAGGGRDTNRRAVLGAIAAEHADVVIVTNEDPYDEDPQEIIDAVADGALQAGKKLNETLFVIADRKRAVEHALRCARPKDLVLITGKGAEQAICVANGKKIPWDDRAITREILREISKS